MSAPTVAEFPGSPELARRLGTADLGKRKKIGKK
jgi:hypothetical protein